MPEKIQFLSSNRYIGSCNKSFGEFSKIDRMFWKSFWNCRKLLQTVDVSNSCEKISENIRIIRSNIVETFSGRFYILNICCLTPFGSETYSCLFEKFALLCTDSLDRIELISPLFLLRLYWFILIFAETLARSLLRHLIENNGCDAIS